MAWSSKPGELNSQSFFWLEKTLKNPRIYHMLSTIFSWPSWCWPSHFVSSPVSSPIESAFETQASSASNSLDVEVLGGAAPEIWRIFNRRLVWLIIYDDIFRRSTYVIYHKSGTTIPLVSLISGLRWFWLSKILKDNAHMKKWQSHNWGLIWPFEWGKRWQSFGVRDG